MTRAARKGSAVVFLAEKSELQIEFMNFGPLYDCVSNQFPPEKVLSYPEERAIHRRGFGGVPEALQALRKDSLCFKTTWYDRFYVFERDTVTRIIIFRG